MTRKNAQKQKAAPAPTAPDEPAEQDDGLDGPMRDVCPRCWLVLEPGEGVTVRTNWHGQREYDVVYCPDCAANLPLRMLELCAGIGAMSYVWQYVLGQTVAGQVELDDYCFALLEQNFPGVPHKRDLYEVAGDEFGTIDLLCAGFPCQPVSRSGKRRGRADDRWLWPEVCRVIRRAKPTWVLLENVDNLVNLGLDDVLADLDVAKYTAWPLLLPAAAVGAPHIRERCFIVGHANGGRSAQWGEPESGRDALPVAGECGPDPRRSGAARTTDGRLADTGGVAATRGRGDVDSEAGAGTRGKAQRQRVRHAAGHRGAALADATCEREREPHYQADALTAQLEAPAWPLSGGGSGDCEYDGDGRVLADTDGLGVRAGQHDLPARQSEPARRSAGSHAGSRRQLADSGGAGLQGAGSPQPTWQPGPAQSGLGRAIDGISAWLDRFRWPAGKTEAQYDWEAPRVSADDIPHRNDRLRAIGNAIVPAQVAPLLAAILDAARAERRSRGKVA